MRRLFAFLLLSIVVAPISAREGVHYFLPRISALKYEKLPSTAEPVGMLGLYYGYAYTHNVAFEFEGNLKMIGGRFQSAGGEGKTDAWNVAALGVFRRPLFNATNAYVKAKVGGVYERLKYSSTDSNVKGDNIQDLYIGLGLGGGYVFENDIATEVEYVLVKDQSHTLNIGFHISFD